MPTIVYPELTLVIPTEKDLNRNVIWGKRILLDLDGVVCEYDFPKIVKGYFGVDLNSHSIFAYDLADVLGVSPDLINKMFQEQVYGKPNFIDSSLEILRIWQSNEWEITIYSNRVKYMGMWGLKDWLIKYGIPFNGCSFLGQGEYNYHIDDSPAKLAASKSTTKLLYTQPWNRRCLDIMKLMTRVDSWRDINNIVR